MAEIYEVVFPIFALAAIGYLSVISGLLPRESTDALAAFVFNVAIPVLLFRSLATAKFSDGDPWALWLSYFPAVLVAWILAVILVAGIVKRGYRASIIAGVAAAFSNLMLVGTPLAERAFGTAGLNIHLLLIAVHLPVMMVISTVLMEIAIRWDGVETSKLSWSSLSLNLLKNLALNPIAIGIVAGSVWRFTGVQIYTPVGQVIDLIGRTAGPLALLALGMSFVKYSIRGNWQPAIFLGLFSVAVMPAFVLFMGTQVFHLQPLWLKVAVLGAACPTGVNAYLFAVHFKVAEGLSSSAIVISALMSIISIPIWLSILTAY